jgi:Carboxypeptidase regulatory-like domain
MKGWIRRRSDETFHLFSDYFARADHRSAARRSFGFRCPNDKPVAHAAVSYQSSGGNAAHAVHTDAHGRFTIHKLPADNYDLRASANGIFSEWEKNVTIHSGQTRSVTLHLIYAKQMPKVAISASKNN